MVLSKTARPLATVYTTREKYGILSREFLRIWALRSALLFMIAQKRTVFVYDPDGNLDQFHEGFNRDK
jgi:hypothetical protein